MSALSGPLTIAAVVVVAVLLTVAYLLLEVDYETRRDVRRIERRQRYVDERRRLSSPRSLR